MSEQRRRPAKHLLVHYFRICLEAAGITWDEDYRAEIEMIVDGIIDAAVEEARQPEESKPKTEAELWDIYRDNQPF